MKISLFTFALVIPCVAACGSSYPVPTQRMADAMSAERSAEEVGATADPRARLHLSLAQEELTRAKALVADGDNRRAEFVLVRARGDAELALALAHEANAKAEAQQALDQASAIRTQNAKNAHQAQQPIPGAAQ